MKTVTRHVSYANLNQNNICIAAKNWFPTLCSLIILPNQVKRTKKITSVPQSHLKLFLCKYIDHKSSSWNHVFLYTGWEQFCLYYFYHYFPIFRDPLFSVQDVNPALYRKVKKMSTVHVHRQQLCHLKDYINTCRHSVRLYFNFKIFTKFI